MSNELIKRIFSSAILLPLIIYLIIVGSLYFNIMLIICFIISFYEWNNFSKKKVLKIIGLFVLVISFFSIYKLRNDFNGEYIWVFFVLLICISTDLGGYIFGKTLKGPKITKISPNKTYSGVIGSYIFSYVLSINFCFLFKNYFLNNSYLEISIIIFLISTVSQIGDLSISFFKRLSNLKDTGNLIPGHGGLLDRIDGMIFSFPFFYLLILLKIFKP